MRAGWLAAGSVRAVRRTDTKTAALTASLSWLGTDRKAGPYIDGRWVTPDVAGDFSVVRNPADGTGLAEVARSDADSVDQAVVSAARAFESPSWRALSPSKGARRRL